MKRGIEWANMRRLAIAMGLVLALLLAGCSHPYEERTYGWKDCLHGAELLHASLLDGGVLHDKVTSYATGAEFDGWELVKIAYDACDHIPHQEN